MNFDYFIIYKPFRMLSQFTSNENKATLANLNYKFNKDIYPVGRLDYDSEGLLLLTNDKRINSKLLNPKMMHERTYLVQVEGNITDLAINNLSKGITININGNPYKTLPAKVKKITEPEIPERIPPIRYRANIPTSWIELRLIEGKNRQVRKMTASTGFPTLRLIRSEIGNIKIDGMTSGEIRKINGDFLYNITTKNKSENT